MIQILLSMAVFLLSTIPAYSQDSQEVLGQALSVYTNGKPVSDSLIAGYSFGGLLGGILFSSIGFVAFVYGKKNTEFKPLIIGVLLIGYPYFVKSTILLYIIGITLTASLYFFRD